MRVYLDTGVFIDYFINRGHAGAYLRKGDRRGRNPKKLARDVCDCLDRIQQKHNGFTSCLTLYELEEALVAELRRISEGSSHANRFIVSSARPAVFQGLMAAQIYDIKLLDVSEGIILKQLQNLELQRRGILGGDSLHVVTAIQADVDIIISADRDIIELDNVFRNSAGTKIRCADTDLALTLI